MLKTYPAILHPERNGYWVSYPNVDGCYSDGESLEEAMENAQEALALHLSALVELEQALPQATNLNRLKEMDDIIEYITVEIEDDCPNNYKAEVIEAMVEAKRIIKDPNTKTYGSFAEAIEDMD